MLKITVKLLKIIKHTVRNTTYSKALLRFCLIMEITCIAKLLMASKMAESD